jgi:hypothetical protein
MITKAQITRRADADGVSALVVERDYVLAHVLDALARLGDQRLVFKGGTALRFCFSRRMSSTGTLDDAHSIRSRQWAWPSEGTCDRESNDNSVKQEERSIRHEQHCGDSSRSEHHALSPTRGVTQEFGYIRLGYGPGEPKRDVQLVAPDSRSKPERLLDCRCHDE